MSQRSSLRKARPGWRRESTSCWKFATASIRELRKNEMQSKEADETSNAYSYRLPASGRPSGGHLRAFVSSPHRCWTVALPNPNTLRALREPHPPHRSRLWATITTLSLEQRVTRSKSRPGSNSSSAKMEKLRQPCTKRSAADRKGNCGCWRGISPGLPSRPAESEDATRERRDGTIGQWVGNAQAKWGQWAGY